MRKGVYAGSFDPITRGHIWMIEQGAALFDELVVAIGTNPEKKHTFSLEERLDMVRDAVGDLPRVKVDTFEGKFLVRYASGIGAQYILRGIRSQGDYEYERGMRYVNADMCPNTNTVFLMPPRHIAEVSSSMVRGLIGPEGWQTVLHRYVPESVYKVLVKRYGHGDVGF